MFKKKQKYKWIDEAILILGIGLITVGLGMEINAKKANEPQFVEVVKKEGSSLGVNSQQVAGKISLNLATKAEFESLPGIGPVLAGRMIEYRKVSNGYRKIEEVQLIKGLSKKVYEQIKNWLVL